MWRDLAAEGVSCGLHRVERLMRLQALKARPRRRRLPPDLGERQAGAIAANVLDRGFGERGHQPQMDRGLRLCLDRGRMALRRSRHRSVLAARGRLVDERGHDGPARHRRSGDGDLAARQARCAAASLRSRQPIQQRTVPAANGRSRRHLLNKPLRTMFGTTPQWRASSHRLRTQRTACKMYRSRNGESKAHVFDHVERFYNPKRRHSTISYMGRMEFERQAGLA